VAAFRRVESPVIANAANLGWGSLPGTRLPAEFGNAPDAYHR
jgi:hypothetical protein